MNDQPEEKINKSSSNLKDGFQDFGKKVEKRFQDFGK